MKKINVELSRQEVSKTISCLRREKDSTVSEIIRLDSIKEKFRHEDIDSDYEYYKNQRDEIIKILEKLTKLINE